MIILETDRLLLRLWKSSDLESMVKINQDPQVMNYFPSLVDKLGTEKLIQKINDHYNQYGYTLYALELKATGEFIGFVGLLVADFKASFTPATEIGWRLSSTHWGKGYAPEAAKALLHYAFSSLELDEVVSFTSIKNKNSIRVMEKIGLQYDENGDFNHPNVDPKSSLFRHVLYRLRREQSGYLT